MPVYETEAKALEAELSGSSGAASTNGRADAPRVVVLFCHAEREDVFALLERLGARQVDAADGLPRPVAAPRGPAPPLIGSKVPRVGTAA